MKDGALSARGVMAEVEKPNAATMMASVTAAAGGQKHIYDLSFGGWYVYSRRFFALTLMFHE